MTEIEKITYELLKDCSQYVEEINNRSPKLSDFHLHEGISNMITWMEKKFKDDIEGKMTDVLVKERAKCVNFYQE